MCLPSPCLSLYCQDPKEPGLLFIRRRQQYDGSSNWQKPMPESARQTNRTFTGIEWSIGTCSCVRCFLIHLLFFSPPLLVPLFVCLRVRCPCMACVCTHLHCFLYACCHPLEHYSKGPRPPGGGHYGPCKSLGISRCQDRHEKSNGQHLLAAIGKCREDGARGCGEGGKTGEEGHAGTATVCGLPVSDGRRVV